MNRNEAVEVLRLLTRPYNVEMDQLLIDVWFNAALAKIDSNEAKRIVLNLVSTQTYMPKPAQFIELRRSQSLQQRQALPPATYEEPSSYGSHYVAAMREDIAQIGKGGTAEPKHSAERWEQCNACRDRDEHIRAHMRTRQQREEF
ncbi:MAG: hypothetical protein E6R03_16730 [Hyphomicrobiaceae bacterium]|nr:MAG: hypothetical protein E6R03_16730 [Hyphomicrobiaceae bacterium]